MIISTGPVKTPQLLMLSGIGPQDHLQKFDITVIKNASVGKNMMEHVGTMGLVFTVDQPISYILNPQEIAAYVGDRSGLLDSPGTLETVGYSFYNVTTKTNNHDPNGDPNVEIIFASTSFANFQNVASVVGIPEDLISKLYDKIRKTHSYMPIPIIIKPKSRGWVELRDTDYRSDPLLYPNFFAEQEDLDAAVNGIELSVNISNQPALQAVGSKIFGGIAPPACEDLEFGSRKFYECLVREFTFAIYHPCGTCKMGPDSDTEAVVDARFRVKGVKGLRVIDSSIIPVIPRAHLNFPSMMIGLRGADFIKEDYNYTTKS